MTAKVVVNVSDGESEWAQQNKAGQLCISRILKSIYVEPFFGMHRPGRRWLTLETETMGV